MDRPIPAYYATYLARSVSSHRSLYIGSTSHPARRVRQHNGFTQGGANKTARNRAHDWSMVCLVAGFPSQVAALQFEWAWQHPHITRHIPNDVRISATKKVESVSRRSGRKRTKVLMAGSYGLVERLKNLRLLLGVHSFGRWPLHVTFYAKDVFDAWTKCDRLGHEHAAQVRLDESALSRTVDQADTLLTSGEDGTATSKNNAISKAKSKTGIDAINTTYKSMAPMLRHSTTVLAGTAIHTHRCAVCRQPVTADELALVCTAAPCRMTAHQTCLAQHFLAREAITSSNATVLPRGGPCPECREPLEWTTLARDLSLRIRGGELIDKLKLDRMIDDEHDDENEDETDDERPAQSRKSALSDQGRKKKAASRKRAKPEIIVIPDSDDYEIDSTK